MSDKFVIIGKIGKTFGIKGLLKVNSYTVPAENIINYQILYLKNKKTTGSDDWQEVPIESFIVQHKNILVKILGCDSIENAAPYTNALLAINRQQLPKLSSANYYWTDLEGLKVINQNDIALGKVDHLFATASNDVLVVKDDKRERLIPFIKDVVIKVDMENGLLIVDWDADF